MLLESKVTSTVNCPKEGVPSFLISVCLKSEAFGKMLLAFFGVQSDFDSVLL
jgi:hypothetical protein